MRIKEVHICNFKNFDDRKFRLNEQFTVFIGENASGKTSVLDAIAIAAGSFFLGIDGVSPRKIHEKEIRIVTIDGQPKPQKPVKIYASGFLPGQKGAIEWRREIINRKTTHKEAREISAIASQMLMESRQRSGVIFPVIAYHGTGRLWAEHEKIGFQKQEEGVVAAYTNCLSAKSSSVEFLSWYKTQEDSIQKFDQPLDKAHLQAFKNTILSLIPDNRWQDMAFDRRQEELTGIFTDNEGKKHKLAYTQLSDGFRNLIGLAADIAYRCIQLNPHLGERAIADTPGIVLIDELDLHLHPNWQRRVVQDLKNAFPKIQFVATTHSPFIVQSLTKEELINLDVELNVSGLEQDPTHYGIEDVAEIEMGVDDVARSDQFKERVELATRYFKLIAAGKTSKTDKETANLRERLNEMEERFSDDPAFVATLRLERKAHNI